MAEKQSFNGHTACQEQFCIKGVAVIFLRLTFKLNCFSRFTDFQGDSSFIYVFVCLLFASICLCDLFTCMYVSSFVCVHIAYMRMKIPEFVFRVVTAAHKRV